MNVSFSVLLYSSDAYRDCWDPFFDLWSKYFNSKLKYEVLLLNNSLDFKHAKVDVTPVNCGLEAPWSKRLRIGIEKAQSDIIFLIGDDFFPLSKVDTGLLESHYSLMMTNDGIDHIRFLYNPGKFKTKSSDFTNLEEILRFTKYRFLFAPSFWKKKSLLKYIVDFESPFMAEKMGTYKSWILNHGMYCVSKEYIERNGRPFDCGSSGVIVKGKWADWSVPLLEKERLGIDFSVRGIRKEEEKKAAMNMARANQLKDLQSTLRSYLSVLKLMVSR